MADNILMKPTIHVQLAKELFEGAKLNGVDEYSFLQNENVPTDILHNLNTRISVKTYYRILVAIQENLQDHFLGFMDHKIPPRAFRTFCEAATGYPDFESVIRFLNDFYGLLTDDFRYEITKVPTDGLSGLTVKFKKDDAHYKKFIIEFIMATTYKTLSWLIGEHFFIYSIHFTFSKPEIIEKSHYLYFLENRTSFESSRNTIIFDSGVLAKPVIRNQQDVPKFLKSSMNFFLHNPDAYAYTRKVRQTLSTINLASGFPRFESVARKLNISHQHLWRKLNREGTSYQQIKNKLRKDMAIQLLTNTQLSISEIAYKVGYAAERPFYRMFSQWTGTSPAEYRRTSKPGLPKRHNS